MARVGGLKTEEEKEMRRTFAVVAVMVLLAASCGGTAQPEQEAEPTTTVAAPTTTSPPTTLALTTTTLPPTTTTTVAAQPLESVVGGTASDGGWRVEPGIYVASLADMTVILNISEPITYLESTGRLDFGPETIVSSGVPNWISLNTFVGVIPPDQAGVHAPHEPLVPDYTAALPDDVGAYLDTIPHLVVEKADPVEGSGFTAQAWDITVDPTQGNTFSCFLGDCVSVLVSESGGVFVFGSEAAARVWEFEGVGDGVYGFLVSRPDDFEDNLAVAEMIFSGLTFDPS